MKFKVIAIKLEIIDSNRFSITFEYLKHIHLYSNNYNK